MNIFQKIIFAIKRTDKGTICRTIIQLAAYINQLIALIGSTSFASHPAYQWISFIVTVVVTGVTYWYNNNWSGAAVLLGKLFAMLQDGIITLDEIRDFMDTFKNKDQKSNSEKTDSKRNELK